MTRIRALTYLHIAALLWGFSGVIGALTTVDSSVIACGRSILALIAVIAWFGIPKVKASIDLPPRVLFLLMLAGGLLGIHWIFFYLSITRGSVAIALATYAASIALIACAEVLLKWAPFRPIVIFSALLSFSGICIIHPITSLEALTERGFLYGAISSIVVACAGLLGKWILTTHKISALSLTVGQLSGAIIATLPLALFHFSTDISGRDILIIAALGIFCSAIGQTLFNGGLKFVPIGTAAIIADMEAPYGVLLAAVLIGQPLTLRRLLWALC